MSGTRDVAIYAPFAAMFYRSGGSGSAGGAELQTTMLARGLAERGLATAHIVFGVEDPVDMPDTGLELVFRARFATGRGAGLREAVAIWRSFAAADAAAYVVRTSGAHLVPAAAFCRLRRRKLIFSASNDLDFDLRRPGRSPRRLRAYAAAVRRVDRLVVQTEQQRDLARSTFPELDPVLIPSFSQPAERATADPEHFLWSDRLVDYKHPERVLDLAAAVPEASFRLIGVETTESPPELIARVRERAERLPNVELLGILPRERLLAELERATALVTTSEVEGMPNTFLEAWARGIPVLSLTVDPDGRVARHEAGIVAGGSDERFAEGARRLWADRDLRDRLGANGRAFVGERHSAAAVADRWLELIRGLGDAGAGTLAA